uniref:Conotoxin Eb6.2 n=1 Tax=Conus eburneus TaxID=101300 RepID=M9PQG6_CONEB|nr:conotoxin Eb6.2 [Conus eburneus]
MKLTCMVIIAVLFLMANQLITADYSRDEQVYRAVRLRDAMQKSKGSGSCADLSEACDILLCCPGLKCNEDFIPICL